MRRLLMIFTAITFVVSSCSKNEILERENASTSNDKIKFTAVNVLGTRAAVGHPMNTTADLRALGKFSVSGYGSHNSTETGLQGYNYLPRQTVVYSGGSWEYANEPIWPAGTIDFMAYAPVREASDESKDYLGADFIAAPKKPTMGAFSSALTSTMTFPDFTVQPATGSTNDQIDFVVAAAPDQSKATRTPLLFKHALTQVVFSANVKESVTTPLSVQISGISIHNIVQKGTLEVPRDGDLSNAWEISTEVADVQSYIADPSSTVSVTATVGGAPAYNRIKSANDRNELLMIPQQFEYWDALESIAENDAPNGNKGAYVKISAQITTRVDPDGIANNGDEQEVYLLGSAGTPGTLYVPIASLTDLHGEWAPGKRINYIITFGDKDAASGGAGYDENGNPILIPIRFTASLENWVEMDLSVLTAEVSGTTSQLTESFIYQYNNLLIGDVYNAPYPKRYKAKTTFISTTEAASNIIIPSGDFANSFISAQFLQESTVTMDFTGAAFATVSPKTISITTPTGWVAAVGGTEASATSFGTGTVMIDGSADKKVIVLKKLPVAAEQYYVHLKYCDYILNVIKDNVHNLSAASDCDYDIGIVPMALLSDDVIVNNEPFASMGSNMQSYSTISFGFEIEDWNGKTIRITVPEGWQAALDETNIAAGADVVLTGAETNATILFSKL